MTRKREHSLNHSKNISNLRKIREMVYADKLSLLDKHLNMSLLSVVVLVTFLFIGFQHTNVIPFFNAWYITVLTVVFLCTFLKAFYKYFPQQRAMYLNLFLLGTILLSSCWGVLGSFLMPKDDHNIETVFVIMIIGISAGGIHALQSNLIASLSFLTITIAPLSIWYFTQQSIPHIILGSTILLFLSYMTIITVRGYWLLSKSLTIKHENIILVEGIFESNAELKESNVLLKNHEHDMNLINKLNETLQLCQNSTEMYSAIKEVAIELFPNAHGGLTISVDSKYQELVLFWGKEEVLQSTFPSINCWAFRTGKTYIVNQAHEEPLCDHYAFVSNGSYICIPLIINNEFIGMVNFNISADSLTDYMLEKKTSFSNIIKYNLDKIKKQQVLQDEAIHDPLTNLYNRRYLTESLSRELKVAIRENRSLCVAMLDIDHFKIFNDNYGHEAGDEELKFIGRYLSDTFRGSDIACRFGGEEFVLILTNTDVDKVLPRLEQVRNEIKNKKINYKNITLPQITISIGLAQAPLHGSTVENIMRASDNALYAAKSEGRDRIIISHSSSKNNN